VSVTVNNPLVPPVISGVASSSVTSSSATITWTTDKPANTQVAFGATSAYGSTSPLNATLTTAHTVVLNGLTPSTTYHYQALSRDAQGSLVKSADFTLVTAAPPVTATPLLQIRGESTETSGAANGSVVTPTITPTGFTGRVVVNGTGSVNFLPAYSGTGVSFLSCCAGTNNALYRFTGSLLGQIFNVNQGQISFYLKSRYSFAQRQTAGGARFAFDVRDDDPTNHVFYFSTTASGGALQFNYNVGSGNQYYYVPAGTEDALFGSGVTLKVTLEWDGSTSQLYLNDGLVRSTAYTKASPNWSAASVFNLGAYEYGTYGPYNTAEDTIDEFTVLPGH